MSSRTCGIHSGTSVMSWLAVSTGSTCPALRMAVEAGGSAGSQNKPIKVSVWFILLVFVSCLLSQTIKTVI